MQKIITDINILIFVGMCGMLMLSVSLILFHIKSQNKFLKQKDKNQKIQLAHHQELLHAIINSQEVERKRIGQDLHDDVGTALSNLRLIIDVFNIDSPNGLKKFSNDCKTIIDKVIKDVRNISHNLSPSGIELYGFLGALEELCDSIIHYRTIQIVILNKAQDSIEQLSSEEAISLYRIMQELLNNTIKHAQATLININFINEENYLKVLYTDNGVGCSMISLPHNGMGLRNIQSRLEMIGGVFIPDSKSQRGYSYQFLLKHQ